MKSVLERLEKAREGRREFWTDKEVEVLKEAIKGGYLAVDVYRAGIVKGRTYSAIRFKIGELKMEAV